MMALRISNATRVLAEEQEEYNNLAIRDELIDGVNHMTSLWEPSEQELQELVQGGCVRLTILGTTHPPVSLQTQAPPGVKDI